MQTGMNSHAFVLILILGWHHLWLIVEKLQCLFFYPCKVVYMLYVTINSVHIIACIAWIIPH
ncbi:hypothetical protein F383_33416 [Gossypium arboreum]|uniref:Uncharacterized protein n=1 Tax=Gossypium arboreum TaxID=29729 RepID=A0A0B0MXG4_GOSAR|nr:hypothetical protein F383_33416 [Gossypium arboreum]